MNEWIQMEHVSSGLRPGKKQTGKLKYSSCHFGIDDGLGVR